MTAKQLALIILHVERRIAEKHSSALRGPRGPSGIHGEDGKDGRDGRDGSNGRDGRDGKNGASFNMADHADLIREWIAEASLTFDKLSPEQKESLRGPTGAEGKAGRDGNDFVMNDHRAEIQKFIQDNKITFADLSDLDKEELRGPRGKDGRDGKSFSFDESKEEILKLITPHVASFEKLTDAQKEELRGPRGKDGRDGKGFVFEDHEDNVWEIIKKVVSNVKSDLKLKFSDLTEGDINTLRLKFEDLTEEEVESLKVRGPRGPRGQSGRHGRDGLNGVHGINGRNGINGVHGKDGSDGIDAPHIIDIKLIEERDLVYFQFIFSDQTVLETNKIKRPSQTIYQSFISNGGGGSGGGGTGQTGVNVTSSEGPLGLKKELEFSDDFAVEEEGDKVIISLVTKPRPITVEHNGDVVGESNTINFEGDVEVEVDEPNNRINVTVDTRLPIFQNEVFVGVATSINVGDGLEVEVDEDSGVATISAKNIGVMKNLTCEETVQVGDVVFFYKGTKEAYLGQWGLMENAVPLNFQIDFPTVGRALASVQWRSKPAGICIRRYTGTYGEECDVRILGVATQEETGFAGLDMSEDYFLSGTDEGKMVPESELVLLSGDYKVRVGQPVSEVDFIYSRGDRELVP